MLRGDSSCTSHSLFCREKKGEVACVQKNMTGFAWLRPTDL